MQIEMKRGVLKAFSTLDLFVSLLETEIKYPILQGDILTFWIPSLFPPNQQIPDYQTLFKSSFDKEESEYFYWNYTDHHCNLTRIYNNNK